MRHRLIVLGRRLSLWCRIVGREHWADHRYGPILAWQTVRIIHPWRSRAS
jgi:hypothetical protein